MNKRGTITVEIGGTILYNVLISLSCYLAVAWLSLIWWQW